MKLDTYQSYLLNRATGYLELVKQEHLTAEARRLFVMNAINKALAFLASLDGNRLSQRDFD